MAAKGNLSKAVVTELVKDATPEQIATLFTGKNGKPCTLVSRARTVEVLGLTTTKKKAVEEYTYPVKRKPRKTVSKVATTSKDYSSISNDKLISTIKELTVQLQALKDELNNRLK